MLINPKINVKTFLVTDRMEAQGRIAGCQVHFKLSAPVQPCVDSTGTKVHRAAIEKKADHSCSQISLAQAQNDPVLAFPNCGFFLLSLSA